MRTISASFCLLTAVTALCGCSLLHDDSLVAQVGKKKLYKSQVVKFIPPGVSEEDSVALAHQYINAWAAELIINEIASEQLSKKEKDVTAELEDYRSSLLKYRYEQHYIQERLNTEVSDEQILAKYEKNPSAFKLSVPILKLRYVKMPASSPLKEEIKEKLASQDEEDLLVLDSLSRTVIDRYTDFDRQWVDLVTLTREYGMGYSVLEEALNSMKEPYIDLVDDQGMDHLSYVLETYEEGMIPPVEYCAEQIREEIISARKYELSSKLEQTLLNDAVENGHFVIYNEKPNEEK